jgi:hypothetical protein
LNHAYFIEIVLVFGAALVWAAWELWTVRPRKPGRDASDRD